MKVMIIDDKYLIAYFGKQSEYFLEKYESYKSGDKFSFSFWAFFAGVHWFLYRKMWFEAIVILLIYLIVERIGNTLLEIQYFKTDNLILTFMIIRFSLTMFFGFVGNYFYLKNAEKTIGKVLSKISNEDERIKTLTKKGGVSWAPYILIVVEVCLLILLNAGII
jgi:hypothetical protein